MEEDRLVVFGPPAPEYNISADLMQSDGFDPESGEYAYKHLKCRMLRAGIQYGYIVKDLIRQRHMIVIKSTAERFWSKFLKRGKDRFALESNHILEIRRMREINGDFYCTRPYLLYYQDICSEWPSKGIKALDR